MQNKEFPGNLLGPGGGDEITLNREPEVHGIMPRLEESGDFPYSRDFAMPEVPCVVGKCPANNGHGRCIMPSCIEIDSNGTCRQYIKVMDLVDEKVKALSIMTGRSFPFCRGELERCNWNVSKAKERIMSIGKEE